MMKLRLAYKAFFSALLLAAAAPASAQEGCGPPSPELIFRLSDVDEGSYAVWDAVYGAQDKQERFVSALAPEAGNAVAAGERFAREGGGGVKLILAELDRRGRTVREKEHAVDGLLEVLKILPAGGGNYAVFANIETAKKRGAVWIGFFGAQGELLSRRVIESPDGALAAQGIAPGVKDGFLVAATLDPGRGVPRHAVIYSLDAQGGTRWSRAYAPGPENALVDLEAGGNGIAAAGYIMGEDGRRGGWVLSLNEGGDIVWQRAYPRGREAALGAVRWSAGDIIAAGSVQPGGDGHGAGWLMRLGSGNGDILWQRYYTGSFSYAARSLNIEKDGVLSLLLQANATLEMAAAETHQDYARLLTIAPRGDLIASDEYFSGQGADARQLVPGPGGERIIAGSADRTYRLESPDGKTPPKTGRSLDGWLAAATVAKPVPETCPPVDKRP